MRRKVADTLTISLFVRYVELHAILDDEPGILEKGDLISAQVLYRCYEAYHEEPSGAFETSGDALLDQIWQTGVTSTRNCIEESYTAGPDVTSSHGI